MRHMLRWICLIHLLVMGTVLPADDLPGPEAQILPGTEKLSLEEPLDVVMVRGINRYAERELQQAASKRTAPWLAHPADSKQGQADRQAARERLRSLIGQPPLDEISRLSRSEIHSRPLPDAVPGACLARTTISTCQWNAFEGVTGRGLLAVPHELPQSQVPIPLVVVIPDAVETPESWFGLDEQHPTSFSLARDLAERGCVVLSPSIIDRDYTNSGHPRVRWTNVPHREFIYRTSFEMGLHPVGYEVAKILMGIQAVRREFPGQSFKPILIGTGEGGLLTLMATALEPDIAGAVVRGYFQERERIFEEPIYRNLFGQLKEFGDAELTSLIFPRELLIDPCNVQPVAGPEQLADRSNVAAPGKIETPSLESMNREYERAAAYARKAGAENALHQVPVAEIGGHRVVKLSTFQDFITRICPETQWQLFPATNTSVQEISATPEFLKSRMKTDVEELVWYSQRAMNSSQALRKILWKEIPAKTVEQTVERAKPFRELVHESFIGRLPAASLPPRPRSRKVLDAPEFSGFEVVLDVHPGAQPASGAQTIADDPGVVAGGILLLPKDLKPGEKRPVVVFQHGLEGTPMDTITSDPNLRASKVYASASAELARRGFVVYAPQNPYRGHDEFRVIQRKSNPIGRSLFSYIIEQHRVTLDWLASLSCVDPDRIAFYGISYGGKTAVRVPPLLVKETGHAGYCLSICSADFNEWIRKNASSDQPYSYVFTGEYEIYEWNMAHVANYAELTWLMIPRPFMVERGLDDGVGPDDWVEAEYARARRPYLKLGIADQISIAIFDGPHSIHGVEAYAFLQKHLKWNK